MDNPFWRFSLSVYGQKGVAPACLLLQDKRDLDVNLLLFCCWAGCCGHSFSQKELARLKEKIAAWQEEVVKPLRAVRRWIKQQDERPSDRINRFREGVKELELIAESFQQQLMHNVMPFKVPDDDAAMSSLNRNSFAQGEESVLDLFSQDQHLLISKGIRHASPLISAENMLLYMQSLEGAADKKDLGLADKAGLAAILCGAFPELAPLEAAWLFE